MGIGINELFVVMSMGLSLVVWLGIAIYLLVLATRLVRAVERIAEKI